jgi:gamma-glutamyltranspeptidase/glutathione hydrolase
MFRAIAAWIAAAALLAAPLAPPQAVSLSPRDWPAGEYDQFLRAQATIRTQAGLATGRRGAVTVAYNALAARAGLEALAKGGNAIDAAMTAALAQVALTGGAPISYFGILSLVYYDAASGRVYTMNAEWNTVRGETDAGSIPGSLSLATEEGLRGTAVSGRTALVGGFLKGVGAAHRRFGRLPFKTLLDPAIYVAEQGMPVTKSLADKFRFRQEDLSRLPATRAIFMKPDGSRYGIGETFRQPALAATLRAVATHGTDYIYKGPWAKKLVAAVQADGGRMTLEDLASYDVIWDEPLVAPIGNGYTVHTNPPPNIGGLALIEAQLLAEASGLIEETHWTKSGASLRKASDIAQMFTLGYLPEATVRQIYPGLDPSPAGRTSPAGAAELWKRMQAGTTPFRWRTPPSSGHSDDVVAIDEAGNIAAITHSINCVDWGRTAINIDGISIGDPASFQQALIARTRPGTRLASPTETGILFKDGVPVMGFASMGNGLHHRTFQSLLNVVRFGMTVDQAIDTPDFLMPLPDATGRLTLRVPKNKFPAAVLKDAGYAYEEIPADNMRFGGEGLWVAISRDPKTGVLRAASHNRNNSAAVAR